MRIQWFFPRGVSGQLISKRAVGRSLIWIFGVGLILIVAVLIPAAHRVVFGQRFIFALIASTLTIVLTQFHRHYLLLKRAEYRVCLHCWSSLPGGEDRGACPSCAATYCVSAVQSEIEAPGFSGPGRRPEMPGPLSRIRRWNAAAMIPIAAVALAGMLGLNVGQYWYAALALVGASILYLAARGIQERQFIRHVEKQKFLVCPRCGYSLGGSQQENLCPECGRGFDKEELRQEWLAHLQWYHGTPGS